MKLYLRHHPERLAALIPAYKHAPLSYTDPAFLSERRTTIEIPFHRTISDLTQENTSFLFDYIIFPKYILRAVTEWSIDHRTIQVDDIIVQEITLPPIRWGLRLVFAVRVLDSITTPTQLGFTYGTLVGHPESGTSHFALELSNRRLFSVIHTFSTPGMWLSQLLAPVLTIPYQQYCTHAALREMQRQFTASNQ
jgi:uncharacterized protein (UPF0548 family)